MNRLSDDIFAKRGTWQLFESADGYDLSEAFEGHIDKHGLLWLRLNSALICTDGRHVIKAHHMISTIPSFASLNQELAGFTSADLYWCVTEDARLISIKLADGACKDHTDKVPSLEEAYWLWTSNHEDIVIGLPNQIIRYGGSQPISYQLPCHKEGTLLGRINTSCIAPDGTLWVGTEAGLHCFSEGKEKVYKLDMFEPVDQIWQINVTESGEIFISTGTNVLIFDPNSTQNVLKPFERLPFGPDPCLVDDEGNLWATASKFGTFCFSRSEYITFPYEDTPGASGPSRILQDSSRNFWFIGIQNGICRYDPSRIHALGKMRIEAAIRAPDGSVLISGATRGIFKYADRCLTQLCNEMMAGSCCMALNPDKQMIILGTYRSGATFYDLKQSKTTYCMDIDRLYMTRARAVRSVAVDHNGKHYYALSHSIVIDDGTKTETITAESLGIAHLHPPRLFADSSRSIWVFGLTSDPIHRQDESGFARLADQVGAGQGVVNCFYEEDDNHIWLGTIQGSVIRINRQTHKGELIMSLGHLTVINDIRLDERGVLWIATSKGLLLANDKETYFLQESSFLPKRNVLKTFSMDDDLILIVTEYGACEYLYKQEQSPLVFISSIQAEESYDRPTRASVYEGNARTVIRLGSINMKTGPLKYQYRLRGHDDSWLDSWQSEIVYERLPIGSYTFEARAIDQDLQASTGIASAEVEVVKDPREKAISRLEGELQEAHVFAESVVRSISEAIVVLNADARIIKTSDATLNLLGYDKSELLGKPVSILFPEDSATRYDVQGITKLAEQRRSSGGMEAQLMKKDGSPLPVLLSASRIYNIRNTITSFVLAASDLTSYQELQTQFLHDQKMESLGVLAGGIAHDFNNMLAIILGNAELTKSALEEDAPVQENLTDIINASEQAAKLCSAMLAYAGKESTHRKAINLSQLLEHNASLLRSSISKKIEIKSDLKQDLPLIIGDEIQLTQVIMNFITNASEAIGDEVGDILLSTSSGTFTQSDLASEYAEKTPPDGDYVVLEVSDTGCGMDERTMRKIFDPFFTTKFTGRGLGLAAVHGILRSHNAALQVRSERGKGTTFTVYCPVSKENATAEPAVETAVDAQPAAGSGTVLIADDEQVLLALAANIFNALGFQTITAKDGVDAVNKLKENLDDISIVLLDITMPRMDGTEAYRHIRHLRENLPIIICSGYSEADISSRFIDDENLFFLHKPFKVEHVKEKLKAAFPAG